MKKGLVAIVIFSCLSFLGFGQEPEIKRLDPTYWWVGMQNQDLQLMVYGQNLKKYKTSLDPYNGVSLLSVVNVENPNYLFINLHISETAQAGTLSFTIGSQNFKYQLKNIATRKVEKVDGQDLIYLVMPDRFANGDPSNDKFNDLADTSSDRNNPFLRHGGDLQGIENHIDYFKDLGVSALWLNPVTENNQYLTDEGGTMRSAYHGYGFTDHYNVDKRLGGNEAYLSLIETAHKNEIAIIQDAVYNHVGINHWMVKDLPMKSWLNQWPTYTQTNYKDQALFDTHASKFDKQQTANGWFTSFLVDLNHKNPLVANYLIQNAIWQTLHFKLDAWRIDTYFYNDLEFMNRCNAAIKAEVPDVFIFGESWVNSVANQAYLTKNNLNVPFKSNLESNVDFQLYFAMLAALNEDYGWNDGVQKLYQVLAQDYLYEDPSKLVTFLDNHDLDRFLSVVGEDQNKFKMGLVWLMTLRGIPQLYYGTEILMKNFKNPTDAEVRKDFPGGWKEDETNKFFAQNRTAKENETFNLIKKLAEIRKNSCAIALGELTQFIPFNDGVYVYFRTFMNEKVMVVSNTSKTSQKIEMARFEEILQSKRTAIDLLTDKKVDLNNLELASGEIQLLTIAND